MHCIVTSIFIFLNFDCAGPYPYPQNPGYPPSQEGYPYPQNPGYPPPYSGGNPPGKYNSRILFNYLKLSQLYIYFVDHYYFL